MLQKSTFSAISDDCFIKKNSMAFNSFSYSSGLEIGGNQRTHTIDASNTVTDEQHTKMNGVQNINILNGSMEKLYINGLSNSIDSNSRGK